MALRVNPAVLHSTAATLQTVNVAAPPPPATAASTHPVSVAAVAQFNTHAANVAGLISHAVALAQRAAATYTLSAHDFAQTDAQRGVEITNALNALTDAMTSTSTAPITDDADTGAPSITIPPHPSEPVALPHPPDPEATPEIAEVSAAALEGGDQAASLQTAATTWRAQAVAIEGYHTALDQAVNSLSQGWEGPAADKALARLRPFAAWFSQAATLTDGVADHAERLVTAHNQVITDHPTAQYVTTLRANYQTAMTAAASGDTSAGVKAAGYRRDLEDAQTRSNDAIQAYATSSRVPAAEAAVPPSPVTPTPGGVPGENPKEGRGKSDPHQKENGEAPGDKPHEGHGEGTPDKDKPNAGTSESKDPPQRTTPKTGTTTAEPLGTPTADHTDASAATEGSPELPLDGSTSPFAGISALPMQAAQMAPQPPQMPQTPQIPQMPMTPQTPPLSNPAGGGTPPSPGVSPASSGGGGVPPISPLGGGSGPAMGGGGGGVPSLSGPSGPAAPAAALPASTPTPSSGPAGPMTGIHAGMPMGGMPMGGGANSGKDKDRDSDIAPDEPVYVEERPHTTAFINGTIGPPPPGDAGEKEQQK